jgi:hypothetical protein
MSLPSLNLSFEKHHHTAATLSSANNNDNSARNSIVLNIMSPTPQKMAHHPSVYVGEDDDDVEFEEEEDVERALTPAPTKKNKIKKEHEAPREHETTREHEAPREHETMRKSITKEPRTPHNTPRSTPKETDTHPPSSYTSPVFDDVEKEFKDQLLFFTTETLLRDLDLLKNIADRGNKILFHAQQLKQLIAILYLSKEDRPKYEELIDI